MNATLHPSLPASDSPSNSPLDSLPGLPTSELHKRLLGTRKRHRQCEYEMCVLLFEVKRRGAYRELQSVSIQEYGRKHLELSSRKCMDLLAIGRQLPVLPELSRVFQAGELGWTKAREVARVATPLTESEWVERALGLKSRALEREVAQCKPGDPPPDYDSCQPLEPERIRLRFDVRSTDALVLRRALGALRAQLGDAEAEDGALLAEMARRVLADGEFPAGETASGAPPSEASADKAAASADENVPAVGPARVPSAERVRIVLQKCPSCCRLTHVGDRDEGGDVEHTVSPTVEEMAACDHEQMETDGPKAGHISRAVPPAMRWLAFHRALYRCEVPGCACHLYLDVHHIHHRADGGEHTLANLLVACPAHHTAVHEGRLRLWRDEHDRVQAEWLPVAPRPEPEELDVLLTLLQWQEMTTDEVAQFLWMTPARARAMLEHAERTCDVVRTVDDLWCRHMALAAELGEVPVSWT